MTENKLTIYLGQKWKLYTNTLPEGGEALGVVSQGGDTGALVKLLSGRYVQINAGVIKNLDGRKVNAALGEGKNAQKMKEGKRVNVYLDDKSLRIAFGLGNGNVSEGIRQALQQSK